MPVPAREMWKNVTMRIAVVNPGFPHRKPADCRKRPQRETLPQALPPSMTIRFHKTDLSPSSDGREEHWKGGFHPHAAHPVWAQQE